MQYSLHPGDPDQHLVSRDPPLLTQTREEALRRSFNSPVVRLLAGLDPRTHRSTLSVSANDRIRRLARAERPTEASVTNTCRFSSSGAYTIAREKIGQRLWDGFCPELDIDRRPAKICSLTVASTRAFLDFVLPRKVTLGKSLIAFVAGRAVFD